VARPDTDSLEMRKAKIPGHARLVFRRLRQQPWQRR